MKFNKGVNILDQITKITSKEGAKEYKDTYIDYIVKDNKDIKRDRNKATEIANTNIGYLAGYCGDTERTRLHNLFEAEHPVFGKDY